jgi:hemolysin activation/secretion protein
VKRRRRAVLLAALFLLPSIAHAQVLIPSDRPGDQRLDLPPLEAPQEDDLRILPPYPVPKQPDTEGIGVGVRVLMREIRITGNTAIATQELDALAEPYENRTLSFADLQELRDQLTLAYVQRGYVTSGAVLPDQAVREGVVEMRIVEGRLEDVEIRTDGRLRAGFLRKRLERGQRGPVNVFALEKRLQLLQQRSDIVRVQAQLVPVRARGLSVLRVQVAETPPYSSAVDVSNYRNPSIGAIGAELWFGFDNAFGIGDRYFARTVLTEGLRQVEVRYQVPLTVYDTLLTVRYQGSWAHVVEDLFPALDPDIDSRSQTIGAELRQPLLNTLNTSLDAYLRFERRQAQSLLTVDGFEIPLTPGADSDGFSNVTALRLGGAWVHRTRTQVVAARSSFSWGIDALGATVNPEPLPDGRFFAWLGQFQWARRLPWLDTQLLARFDTQIANDRLLPLEQFAIGGRYTVRGYRENQLVRDNGLVGSIEARIPVYRRVEPEILIELAPFFDGGYSWSANGPTVGQQTLLSVGIGTRMQLTRLGFLEFYWGHGFNDVVQPGEAEAQDHGIHFRIAVNWP